VDLTEYWRRFLPSVLTKEGEWSVVSNNNERLYNLVEWWTGLAEHFVEPEESLFRNQVYGPLIIFSEKWAIELAKEHGGKLFEGAADPDRSKEGLEGKKRGEREWRE
jgi:hypothetical protein